MALCRYFLRGNCRYGSKCRCVHLDVKAILKADVEASINGKQWPLSCYGLFKDKACIPNFVEDQSFEEIRMMCYEAKQKNYFEQFHQQFTKEVIEATNKMKSLLQYTPDLVETVINIYNAPVNAGDKNNLFSLFKPNDTSASTTNSIFSNSSNLTITNTPFNNNRLGGAGDSIFGGTHKSQLGNNPFGSTTAAFQQQQPQQSAFGQTNVLTNSIFGGTNSAGGSIFSQPQNMNTRGSIFAQQMNQPQTTGNFGLFSEAMSVQLQPQSQTSSIFTQQAQPTTNIFSNAFQTPNTMPQQLGNQNLFNAATVTQSQNCFAQPTQTTQNIFAQALQPEEAKMMEANQEQVVEEMMVTNIPLSTTTTSNTFNTNVYSSMNSLTADEIEAFKADRFEPGKIPVNPPPKELIA